MMRQSTFFSLQLQLQSYGAIRPEAWQQIEILLQQKQLKTNQSFIRKEGTLAFIASGILKEYDATNRISPSIINFISKSQAFTTRRHNKYCYLKAGVPTLIWYLEFEQLQYLYLEFKELKKVYDGLCADYDESIALRQLILETPSAAQRITLFRTNFKSLMSYLKKKDIANYLHLNYTHFLHVNNHLP